MNKGIRTSLKIGLLAAGVVFVGSFLGSGLASAHATPDHVVAQPVAQAVKHSVAHPVAHPQYIVKRGPVGMFVDGVVRHLQAELAPPHVMQPMGLAVRP